MNLSEALAGLLGRPLNAAEVARAEAYAAAATALLRARYGAKFEERLGDSGPFFDAVIASAVARRMQQSPSGIESQTSGPFSVRYSGAISGGNWFLPGELRDLDAIFGHGGSRTYRTPAPDAQRRLNRMNRREVGVAGSLGGYPVEPYGDEYLAGGDF
ncbi:hypothetical protein [Dermabacter hominis]|uniref:hypothetical protein n=1 Tax=Dermabacter hominis TaxID=36740 RepID=UPI002432EBE3|nr:hypothetical protein [Dermabacter hominis]